MRLSVITPIPRSKKRPFPRKTLLSVRLYPRTLIPRKENELEERKGRLRGTPTGAELRSGCSFAASACREGLGIFSHGLAAVTALPADAVMSATPSIPRLTCLRHLRSRAALSAHPLFRPRLMRPPSCSGACREIQFSGCLWRGCGFCRASGSW